MDDFGVKKHNIHIEVSKKKVLKNFLCEYKLSIFLSILIIILFTILGIEVNNKSLFLLLYFLNGFILLGYLLVILFYIMKYNYIIKIHNSEIFIKDFINEYKFDNTNIFSVKLKSELKDNQEKLEYTHDYKYDIKTSDMIFNPIINLIKTLRKVEKKFEYLEIEFFCKNKPIKCKIPYKTIKTVNGYAKLYQYISEEDIDDLLILLKPNS